MASTKTSGFTLLEVMIALSVILILSGIAVMTLQPTLQAERVNNAYNTTLTSLRLAREAAAADMRIYVVSFSGPVTGTNPNGGTITVTQNSTTGTQLFSTILPSDVTFHVEPGVPTSQTTAPTTPDGFGSAANVFDFDQGIGTAGGSTIYFYPDGTAHDLNGNINNGVVYLGRPGFLGTCRAITLWGATSRLRGWRLYQNSGVWSWSQQ
jgi:prepilin-type N-terminal cleavage/methylation domain-containing protein